MGKLETSPTGQPTSSSNDPNDPLVPVLPPVQSQPAVTVVGTPQPAPQFHNATDWIPAVAVAPPAKIPEIHTVPSNQHVTNVAPQSNGMQNMSPGVTMGQIPGTTMSSSVRQQPMVIVPDVGNPWHSALITTIAPCITFGQIAEILDNGSTGCVTGGMLYLALTVMICHWNIGSRYRRRLRIAFKISETPVSDRIAHFYFPLCALCQEFRELKSRGLDPFLGYQGAIAQRQHEEQQQQLGSNPPDNQFMMR
ncbi:hypothetical protein HHK36_014123 [Tetracentron sinense]|uniref:Uncharacterized protein n=1 Tax=Tetracentron sinense TaxID=13715 RepID=A0A834ZBN7_TETSI|nr:hypothetical protein HHK36_014123 [Tetracentron sinense]